MMHFYYNTYDEFTAVSFQFSLIGNDIGAQMVLEGLYSNHDLDIGKYIDVLHVDRHFEPQLVDKWFVVCHTQLLRLMILNGSPTDFILVFG